MQFLENTRKESKGPASAFWWSSIINSSRFYMTPPAHSNSVVSHEALDGTLEKCVRFSFGAQNEYCKDAYWKSIRTFPWTPRGKNGSVQGNGKWINGTLQACSSGSLQGSFRNPGGFSRSSTWEFMRNSLRLLHGRVQKEYCKNVHWKSIRILWWSPKG